MLFHDFFLVLSVMFVLRFLGMLHHDKEVCLSFIFVLSFLLILLTCFSNSAMAQMAPQFTLADIQQAVLNLFYYNSLTQQQPALQNHFAAWPQATAPVAHHHHAAGASTATSRSPFRASYDQQAAERLFNQPGITRTDAPWYDASVTRQPPPAQTSVISTAPVPARNPPQPASAHPYLTFPFPYHSALAAAAAAASAAAPQHFYYHATPGYYYQPAPASVSSAEPQNSTNGGTVNQVSTSTAAPSNQAAAMNDFMAAIVTASQMPFISAPAAAPASAYPGDMGMFLLMLAFLEISKLIVTYLL